MAKKKYLAVIGGATATGKTALAVRLAQHFGTEILSCDSRQFFREMTIGTAKPTAAEMQGIPHHFIDSHSVFETYSVGDFEQEALVLLQQLYEYYDLVIAVGGSGLYIKALCEGLDQFPDIPDCIRREVRELYAAQGLAGLQQAVKTADPAYFEVVDQQNPHRLLRALEVCLAGEQPFSAYCQGKRQPRSFTPIYLQTDLPRPVLYERINRRVDAMIANGLLEEACALYPHRQLPPLQTVGYQELFDYFDGLCTLAEAIEKIKQSSRNYAKRQLTWYRRDGFWHTLPPGAIGAAIDFITSAMKEFK